MYGTASTGIDVWFLLEHTGPWGAKAAEEVPLPAGVRPQLAAIPRSRLLLIKHHSRRKRKKLAFYVAVAREGDERLYRFTLPSYEALLEFKLPAIVAGEPDYEQFVVPQPVFVVCTNGRRDRCCARYGPPVYRRLAAYAAERGEPTAAVWQCSHLGGHRFAASMATFPHGSYYGRLTAEDLPDYVATQRAGALYLPNYRGRTTFDLEAQVAECYLREATGITELSYFRLVGQPRSEAGGRWLVRFQAADGLQHLIHLQREPDRYDYLSCGAGRTKLAPQFTFLSHQSQS